MIRPISEGDAWVTNEDGDIIGIQLHGRSEVVDLSNPVNGKVDPVTGRVEFSATDLVFFDTEKSVRDVRTALAFSAGVYVENSIYSAVSRIGDVSIPKSIFYVSNNASNGFASGNDANNGLSKAAPFLTLQAAHAAASNGDKIVINDSATPYSSAFYTISKSISIVPYSDRGVTLQCSGGRVLDIAADNVTLGALILDSNAVSAVPLSSGLTTDCTGLKLYGTKLLAHSTYAILHYGSLETFGNFEVVSTGAVKSRIRLDTKFPGQISIGAGAKIDASLSCNPSVAGVHVSVKCSDLHATTVGATSYAIFGDGVESWDIYGNNLHSISAGSSAGVCITGTVARTCKSVKIHRNKFVGVNGSASAVGYGIAVGSESAVAGVFEHVEIVENDVSHVNHGVFAGHGILSGFACGNVVRDSVIGCISKGNTAAFTFYSNIVIGGILTGGALRAKECTGARFYNNLVIFDAQSVAAGSFEQADTTTTGADFANNILYAPGVQVAKATLVAANSTATFRSNNYFSGSFAATAFNYGASNYASVAAWSAAKEATATGVDPLFVNSAGDYRLSSASPLKGSGASVDGVFDYFGGAMTGQAGPMPVYQ